MAKCAVCIDNVVVNIIIAALDEKPANNGVLINIDNIHNCDIGWIYENNTFVNPNPPEWSDL